MNITKHPNDEKIEEITAEKAEKLNKGFNEALRLVAMVAYFEEEFCKMPHSLRIFAWRRWWREFKAFQLGFKLGQKYAQRVMERQEENL
ncbi:hypothetical protein DRQ11_08590 [candidate division KSB1 bacterium]|nr:MAG: hypothetical protein DRQ11_08590 [candidate division KSB1 bacterium]